MSDALTESRDLIWAALVLVERTLGRVDVKIPPESEDAWEDFLMALKALRGTLGGDPQ